MKLPFSQLTAWAICLSLPLILAPGAHCATEQVLTRFNSADGALPDYGPMVMDKKGNLYGTTEFGGGSPNCSYGCGTVFQLTKKKGVWTQRLLYSFSASDGSAPTPGLVQDKAGNLYGVTDYGGSGRNCTQGCGVVFELVKGKGGLWTEKTLYNFQGDPDGAIPNGALTLDAKGNLYGTTWAGGTGTQCLAGCGTVFEVQKVAGGNWKEKTLYSFLANPDGAHPWAVKPVFDASGNLYGTTYYGGDYTNCTYGCGTVFELSPVGKDLWAEKVIHTFTAVPDGSLPVQGVVIDAFGNLYGVAPYGGDNTNCTYGCGIAYELSAGSWAETILHEFEANSDGSIPTATPVLDTTGNLFGETLFGGDSTNCTTGCGTVYKLSQSGGIWSESIVYSFQGAPDGSEPSGSLILDPTGKVYGTTYYGGDNTYCTYGCGIVYELTP